MLTLPENVHVGPVAYNERQIEKYVLRAFKRIS